MFACTTFAPREEARQELLSTSRFLTVAPPRPPPLRNRRAGAELVDVALHVVLPCASSPHCDIPPGARGKKGRKSEPGHLSEMASAAGGVASEARVGSCRGRRPCNVVGALARCHRMHRIRRARSVLPSPSPGWVNEAVVPPTARRCWYSALSIAAGEAGGQQLLGRLPVGGAGGDHSGLGLPLVLNWIQRDDRDDEGPNSTIPIAIPAYPSAQRRSTRTSWGSRFLPTSDCVVQGGHHPGVQVAACDSANIHTPGLSAPAGRRNRLHGLTMTVSQEHRGPVNDDLKSGRAGARHGGLAWRTPAAC